MSFFVGFNFKRKRPQMYEFIQSAFASLQHTLYLRPAQAEWEQGLPRPTSCASLTRAQWAQAIGGSLPFFVVETFHPFLNCAVLHPGIPSTIILLLLVQLLHLLATLVLESEFPSTLSLL